MTIDWNNLNKIRIKSSSKPMMKHEVVKFILALRIHEKYRNKRNWTRIYTDFELDNNIVPDVYFEDVKEKTALAFEIQKNYSVEWLKDRTIKYKDYCPYNFNSFDWIPIDLNLFPDDIFGIWDKLGEYI